MTDPLLGMVAGLPQGTPDRERAARVRARCHAVLAHGRPRAARRRGNGRLIDRILAYVGPCLGAAYLIESVRLALHLAGFLH